MLDNEGIEEHIRQFTSNELRVKPEKLKAQTSLQDLGVDGDDGIEFMQAFAQRFGVNLADFESSFYFGAEGGCNPLILLVYLFFPASRPKFVPITVSDLLQAAQERKWRRPRRDAI